MGHRILLTVLISLLALLPCDARRQKRNAQTVKKEQQATRKKIDNTRRRIQTNLDETRRELSALQSIEGDIRLKRSEEQQLRTNIGRLRSLSNAIADSVEKKEAHLHALRDSYGKALRMLRRQRQSASAVSFLFSSDSYRQARSRVRYLAELSRWEEEKASSIRDAAQALRVQKAQLDSARSCVARSLDSLSAVQLTLREQKHKADAVVGSLKRQGRNLNKVLAEQQQLAKRLDDELNRIIEEEARQAAEEARRKAEAARRAAQKSTADTAPAPPRPSRDNNTAPKALEASDFVKHKGNLRWPVDRKALVVSTFGRHTHSEYSKVQTQNNGIDLETSAGAHACAVYPGTVSMVIVMDGYHNVVLVRHGEYLTVYAGIESPSVRKGQKVEAGQDLGLIRSDASDGGRTRLHFEVRHEKEKLDPAQWLR